VATIAPHQIAAPATARSSALSFIIKASRPGLWATAVWFYLLPLGRRHVFDSVGFWLGLIYVTLPLGLIIYGWNDIADAEIDKFNPRKGTFLFGARGSQEQLRRLPLQLFSPRRFSLPLSFSLPDRRFCSGLPVSSHSPRFTTCPATASSRIRPSTS